MKLIFFEDYILGFRYIFYTLCIIVVSNNCMQVLGKIPTISIDKTDGCQMFLSTESLNVELITSKSSEMNVMIPKANGDYVSNSSIDSQIFFCDFLQLYFILQSEYPVPEQFKTTISKKGLHTIAVDSLG